MPLSDPLAQALLAGGVALWGANTLARRRLADGVFRITYALGWPVLGTGVMLAVQPDRAALEATLRAKGYTAAAPAPSPPPTNTGAAVASSSSSAPPPVAATAAAAAIAAGRAAP